ncbi:glycosyltransferase [Marinobacter vulgaris]|uniref:Glycosyltransferase n=1 Tax=Marinobacter vulgaris TaxID=1928331 RepID=A0A2V3ZXZ6_9GAMM|nr:glycosyltransferase [Marinobacter vulgaris]PXX90731.1 glycosyltransferase [Marinobacter vulgaris]TSJ70295.1 glycosyltransferase [Marinobacter vulgaris]
MEFKVLHLIDSGGLYGAEKMLLDLATKQKEKGLNAVILSAGVPGEGIKSIEEEGAARGISVQAWRMKPGFNLKGAIAILRWAQREGFDILHSHGYKFNVLLGMLPNSYRKLPLVSTLHGYTYSRPFSKGRLYEVFDKLALTRASRIVVVSSKIIPKLPFFIKNSNAITMITNGIDVHKVEICARQKINMEITDFLDNHSPVVLGVGRFSREKNFAELIKSVSLLKKQYKNIGLILAGDGPLLGEASKQARESGLFENVLFPGYINNIHPLIRTASVLAIPSISEGLPITLLEAMALKTGVVVTDVGEMGNVVGFGKGGVIIDRPYADDIASAIQDFLSEPEEETRRIEWAFKAVNERYSLEKMVMAYEDVYRSVTHKNLRPSD